MLARTGPPGETYRHEPMRTVAACVWPIGALAGVAVQLQQAHVWPASGGAGWGLMHVVTFALCAVWLGRRQRLGWPRVLIGALALALFGFCTTAWRAQARLEAALPPHLQGADIDVVGTVATMVQTHPGGVRFRLNVEHAALDGLPTPLPKLIDVGWYSGYGVRALEPQAGIQASFHTPLQPGERWAMRVRLKSPHGHQNPHGFDYELWLWEQGVGATGYVRSSWQDPPPTRLDSPGWQFATTIERARQRTRDAIMARVEDARAAGVLAALVVGDQRAIDRADWDVFRATGVAHLMSISGLHVTLFAWMCAGCVGWAWRRSARHTHVLCEALPAPMAGALGGWLLALAYAVFSGWGVPAQRTVWMLGAVVATRLLGVRWPWPLVWLMAAVVVVALDPWALLLPGFWLSFVAVGILFATDQPGRSRQSVESNLIATNTLNSLADAENSSIKTWPIFMRLGWGVARVVREQWLIGLALAPLTLMLFGQVSLVGLFANLLAIPWVTFVITPLAMLGGLTPWAWDLGAWAVQVLQGVLAWSATWPWAVWQSAVAPLGVGLVACLGGAFMVMPGPRWQRALGFPLVLPLLMWQGERPKMGHFELVALDVGQGSAVVVRTHRHTLLYDAGPAYGQDTDAGQRVVLPYLRSFNEVPNEIVLTHADIDHTGGALAVMAAYPNTPLRSSLDAQHRVLSGAAGLVSKGLHTRCVAGQAWQWDGVSFEVLHPSVSDYAGSQKTNALSCVLRVSNGQQTALLTGDIEFAQEAQLLNASAHRLKADILMVPHHGSQTSSTQAFVAAVSPKVAIAQAGYRNRFGHPAASVQKRYADLGIDLRVSSSCGAANWRSDQPGVSCARHRSPRYWHAKLPR